MSATERSGNGGASAATARFSPSSRERFLHTQLDRGDVVVDRDYLGAEALRVEIHKPGTRRETVWFEMGRA